MNWKTHLKGVKKKQFQNYNIVISYAFPIFAKS